MQLGRESGSNVDEVCELSKALGNVTIVKKGPHDVIALAEKSELDLSAILLHIFRLKLETLTQRETSSTLWFHAQTAVCSIVFYST